MTPDQEKRLTELIELNEEVIRKHAAEHNLELSDEDLRDEAARAALDQLHDELDQEQTVYLIPREEFDGALIRIEDGIAIYSAERVIQVYMKRDGMTEQEALDYFYYNCEGAYVGPYTPRYEWEDYEQ